MSGFLATSGKYEVFAPGSDTYVMFNVSQDLNAVSSFSFAIATATLTSAIFHTGADGTSLTSNSDKHIHFKLTNPSGTDTLEYSGIAHLVEVPGDS